MFIEAMGFKFVGAVYEETAVVFGSADLALLFNHLCFLKKHSILLHHKGSLYFKFTVKDLEDQFKYISTRTLWRQLATLKDMGVFTTATLSKDPSDRSNYYSLNEPEIRSLFSQKRRKVKKAKLVKKAPKRTVGTESTNHSDNVAQWLDSRDSKLSMAPTHCANLAVSTTINIYITYYKYILCSLFKKEPEDIELNFDNWWKAYHALMFNLKPQAKLQCKAAFGKLSAVNKENLLQFTICEWISKITEYDLRGTTPLCKMARTFMNSISHEDAELVTHSVLESAKRVEIQGIHPDRYNHYQQILESKNGFKINTKYSSRSHQKLHVVSNNLSATQEADEFFNA